MWVNTHVPEQLVARYKEDDSDWTPVKAIARFVAMQEARAMRDVLSLEDAARRLLAGNKPINGRYVESWLRAWYLGANGVPLLDAKGDFDPTAAEALLERRLMEHFNIVAAILDP